MLFIASPMGSLGMADWNPSCLFWRASNVNCFSRGAAWLWYRIRSNAMFNYRCINILNHARALSLPALSQRASLRPTFANSVPFVLLGQLSQTPKEWRSHWQLHPQWGGLANSVPLPCSAAGPQLLQAPVSAFWWLHAQLVVPLESLRQRHPFP